MRAQMVVVVCLFLVGAARADDPASLSAAQRTERSRAHFELGRAHFNLGEFDAAEREFEEGYRLKPMPLFLYNVAQSARRAGHGRKALELYRRYLVVSPNAAEKREVDKAIVELEAELAKPVEPLPVEKPSVEKPPVEKPQDEKPLVEKPPVENPSVEKPPVETPPPEARQLEPLKTTGATALGRLRSPSRAWYQDWLGWALTATGAFALTVALIDFGVTYPRYANAGHDYRALASASDTPTRLTVDLTVVGLGAAMVACGAVRFFFQSRKAARDRARFSLAPVLDGKSAALVVGGVF